MPPPNLQGENKRAAPKGAARCLRSVQNFASVAEVTRPLWEGERLKQPRRSEMRRAVCMLVFASAMTTSAVAEVVVDRTVPDKAWTYNTKEAVATTAKPDSEPAHPCAEKANCNLPCRLVEHPNYHGKPWAITLKHCRDCSPYASIPVSAGVRSKWVCGTPGHVACVNWYTDAGEKQRTWWNFGTREAVSAPPRAREARYMHVAPRRHHSVSYAHRRSCTECSSAFHQRFRRHFTCCSSR